MKTTFKHIDLNDSVDDFMNHLNNNMNKPDGYSYELSTRGSKYFKVIMNTRGSRSVYCFINKRNGEILKSAGWRAPAKGARGSFLYLNHIHIQIGVVDGYTKFSEMFINKRL